MPIHFAALAEPVACVTRAVNRLNVVAGDTVAVVGAGLMGLLFLKLLKLRGCRVIVVQRSEKRRENAKAAGADVVIDPSAGDWSGRVLELTGKLGAAAVVYTAGGSKVINDCMRAARVGATLLLYAPTLEESVSIDIDQIHFKELVVTGALRHDKESFRQAVRLLGSGLLNYDGISLSFGSFERFEEEMRRADADRDIHRILLRW
jgi:L-iditol 2-dehydrogenase